MTAINRTRTRANERARRARFELGYELRQARLGAGLSQTVVGRSLGWAATKVSRIEGARLASLSLDVADTRHNRRVLDEFAEMFVGLLRLRTANVVRLLRAGRHPPTGTILV